MAGRKFRVLLLVVAAAALAPVAHAHEASELRAVMPIWAARVEGRYAAFNLGRPGTYAASILGIEANPHKKLGLNLSFPVYYLRFKDGTETFGPGDLELAARVHLFHNRVAHLAVGAYAELPTGRTDLFLGGGHFVLGPTISGCVFLKDWKLHFDAAQAIALTARGSSGGHHHDAKEPDHAEAEAAGEHGVVFVDPHSNLELILHAAFSYTSLDWLTPRLLLTGIFAMEKDPERRGFASASFNVDVELDRNVELTAGVRIPLTLNPRYNVRTFVGLEVSFGPPGHRVKKYGRVDKPGDGLLPAPALDPPPTEPLTFADVEPTFERYCYGCHGAEGTRTARRHLDMAVTPFGGHHGDPLAGIAGAVRRREHNGLPKMPMGMMRSEISDVEIATILRWIEDGGSFEDGATPRQRRRRWVHMKITRTVTDMMIPLRRPTPSTRSAG